MSVLPIRVYPDPALKEQAAPVEQLDYNIKKLIENMGETMFAAQGVGLAAPQVGESCRVIVIYLPEKKDFSSYMALINPEIISAEGEVVAEEGCLSARNYRAQVKRAQALKVCYLNDKGAPCELTARDLLARVLQHEIDHLNGILFFERLSRIKRDLIRNRLRKLAKAAAVD